MKQLISCEFNIDTACVEQAVSILNSQEISCFMGCTSKI